MRQQHPKSEGNELYWGMAIAAMALPVIGFVAKDFLAHRRLRLLDEDFLTLLEHTTDFIYFKDHNSRIRFASRTLANLAGYSDWRSLVGKHDREIFPPESAAVYMEEERPVFHDGKPLLNKTDPYFASNGEQRWVNTNKWPVFGSDGKTVVGIFGISHDVTDQKRAEDGLRRLVVRYQTLLRTAGDGIHILDHLGNVVEANDVFCRMLGYTSSEIRGLNVSAWDAQWNQQELQEIIAALSSEPRVFETRHRRRDGTFYAAEVSAVAVQIDGERLVFASSRDISARKQTEEDLRRVARELSDVNRLKDVFTDVLRHDILTPLSTIKLASDLLVSSVGDPRKNDLARKIQQSARNIEEMTVNAAKLAALEAQDQAPEFLLADPEEIVRSVLPDFEHKLEKKHQILDEHLHGGFSVQVNPMVKDVVANMVSNAIKYSPEGAHIGVETVDCGETWIFAVRDEGAGVPDEHKTKIFNRFERLNKEGVKGSGLGLTITRQIVALHGGDVWVEDNATGGSRFLARFPKTPPPSRASAH